MAHAVTRRRRGPRRHALIAVSGAAFAGVLLLGGCSAAGGGPSPSSPAPSGQVSDPATGSTAPDGTPGAVTSSAARSGSRTASPGSGTTSARSSTAGGTATSPGTTRSASPGRSSSHSASSGTKPPTHHSSAPAAPNPSTQLLALSDLPSGWAVASSGSSGGDGGVQLPACFTAADRSAQAAASATVAFAQRQQLPVLTEDLGYYPGSSATSNYSAAVSALDSCVGTTVSVSADGYSLKGKVLSLSLSGLGDASRAYGVSLSGYGFTLWLGISVVRTGHELVAVVYAAQGQPDTDSLQHYAGRAVTKAS